MQKKLSRLATKAMKSRTARMATIAVAAGLVGTTAHATGTDTTFDTMNTKLETWISGSLGILLGLGGLLVSIVGMLRQQWGAAAVGIVVALAGATGPAIIKGIFTGVI